MYNITSCILAIQRYEYIKDIEEWVEYHLKLGFDKIFIMDNNDKDYPLVINEKYQVDIIPYYGQRNDGKDWKWQREAYNYGFDYIRNKYPNKYQYISIIDIDEFITLYKQNNIKDFIQEELINNNYDNLELKWKLYNDNNIIKHNKNFEGHVLDTYNYSFPIENNYEWNSPYKFVNMKLFTKFIGKFKDELYYKESAHYPAIKLYDDNIYNWILCDDSIAVCRHYKYKSLEDFISQKCKYRNYITSVHGSAWKYSRTYFEDNMISIIKLFYFVIFEYKYNLNMEKWDIEYLQLLLSKINNNNPKNIFIVDFSNNNLIKDNTNIFNSYKDYNVFILNEYMLDLDICSYVRTMYDFGKYDKCNEFYEKLFMYYFGGLDINNNEYIEPFNEQYKEYIIKYK